MDKINGLIPPSNTNFKESKIPAKNSFRNLIVEQLFESGSTKTDIKKESQALMAQLNIERKYIN